MNFPAVVLEDVRRSFGARKVLDGVTGTVERGRVVGLLGRNGEGKTTLFKAMLDLLALDSGRIEILGHPVDGTGAARALVGYVPERPVFHDFLTAGEALELRRRFFPSWKPGAARDLARRLELDLSTPVAGASKGTLAKLAWVCAAAHEPDLLLLDEPTSGLDALVRDGILTEFVGELQREGRAIVVANHRMEELAGLLDEVWVLANGRIAARHGVEELRGGALRLRGRLKAGGALDGLPGRAVSRAGELVEWAVLAPGDADVVSARLESVERAPLPLAETLKLLLPQGGQS